LRQIVFSDEAKDDIRAIPKQIAMNILTAIHRLAESEAGDVKTLRGQQAEKRLRVGDFRVRFLEVGEKIRIQTVKNRKDAYR
jgi:mRNA-degrading endonuclease RelE of RelBE toxin-antitoxin system